MKPTFIFITVCTFFFLTSCQKKEKIRFYFYQNVSAELPHTLQLDGENRGELPFLQEEPNCLDSDIQANALVLPVEHGSHRYKLLNENGTVISEGKFRVSSNKFSSTGTKGRSSFRIGDDCAAAQMGE